MGWRSPRDGCPSELHRHVRKAAHADQRRGRARGRGAGPMSGERRPLGEAFVRLYETIAYLSTSDLIFRHAAAQMPGPPRIWDLVTRIRVDLQVSLRSEGGSL